MSLTDAASRVTRSADEVGSRINTLKQLRQGDLDILATYQKQTFPAGSPEEKQRQANILSAQQSIGTLQSQIWQLESQMAILPGSPASTMPPPAASANGTDIQAQALSSRIVTLKQLRQDELATLAIYQNQKFAAVSPEDKQRLASVQSAMQSVASLQSQITQLETQIAKLPPPSALAVPPPATDAAKTDSQTQPAKQAP